MEARTALAERLRPLADPALLEAAVDARPASLGERSVYLDRARALILDLLGRLPADDPAGILAPSAELRAWGLLRYAFRVAVAERLDGLAPLDLDERLPGIEPVMRALESLHPELPADFREAPELGEHGRARRRIRAYARVVAQGLDTGRAVADHLGLPELARADRAIDLEEIAAYAASPEGRDLVEEIRRAWADRRTPWAGRFSDLETASALIRRSFLSGMFRYEKGAFPDAAMAEADIRLALTLTVPGTDLERTAAAQGQRWLPEIVAAEWDNELDERLFTAFATFAVLGFLVRRQLDAQ